MQDQVPKPPSMTILRGGVPFPITDEEGKPAEVFVHIIPIRLMDEYLARYESITLLVELVCDKPIGWADALSEDDLYAINRKARELNDPRFDRWTTEQAATVGTKLQALLTKLRG